MRVVEVDRRGGPEVLSVAEREAPRPGPGQVVVDVAAAGVNFMDIYQRQGVGGYQPDLPFVPGAEGAGTVAAVGDEELVLDPNMPTDKQAAFKLTHDDKLQRLAAILK